MERLKETMFETMLYEKLSAACERSQHLKAQHHTRFFALKNVLEECNMTAEYYEYRQKVLQSDCRWGGVLMWCDMIEVVFGE